MFHQNKIRIGTYFVKCIPDTYATQRTRYYEFINSLFPIYLEQLLQLRVFILCQIIFVHLSQVFHVCNLITSKELYQIFVREYRQPNVRNEQIFQFISKGTGNKQSLHIKYHFLLSINLHVTTLYFTVSYFTSAWDLPCILKFYVHLIALNAILKLFYHIRYYLLSRHQN